MMHKSEKAAHGPGKTKKSCKVYLLTVQSELKNLPYSTKIWVAQEFVMTYVKPIIL